MSELLIDKLLPPRMETGLIDRPRLLQLLAGLESRKATLLTAPPGYGKTVLAHQLAVAVERTLVWYQLDEYDNDPAVFLRYLLAGFAHHFPGFGRQALQAIRQGIVDARLRLLATMILNGLARHATAPILLILDDYHVITEPAVHRFVQDFLEHLPAHVHVVIASRTTPPLTLPRLNVRGDALIMGPEDLRFTDDEVKAFLALKPRPLSAEALEFIEHRASGWPAALKLMAGSASAPAMERIGTKELYEYLAAEVFERQPPSVQRFLLASSVLETMTAARCDRLLERNDSQAMLATLEKQQLFLVPLAGEHPSYRYHQLFREFLLDRLGAERYHLMRRCADRAREAGELDQAVELLLAGGSTEGSLELLKEASGQALRRGRWQTVYRWLRLLPKEQIAADNWLSLFRARVEIHLGRLDEAEIWITKANTGFSEAREGVGLAESQVVQARLLRCRGRYEESSELIEQAYNYLQQNGTSTRFDLTLEKYLIFLMTGKFKAAEEFLVNALQAAEQENDNLITAYLLEGLGNIYYLQGDYYKALQIYKKGEALSPDRILPSYYMQDNIAAIYQEWGELDRALEYAKRNILIKESFGATEALPSAYYQLAVIYMDYGEFRCAREYFSKAIELMKANNGELLYLTLNKIFLARCLSLEGKMIESLAKAREAMADAERQSGLILAICKELYASIIAQLGNIWEAERLLKEVSLTFKEMGFQRGLCFSYSGLAVSKFLKHNIKEAGKYARLSLELGSRKNFIQSYVTLFNPAQPILRFGLEQGIEINFIHQVMVRRGTQAIPFLNKLASHSAPEVRARIILPLAEIGGPKAYSLVVKLTKDKDAGVRELAQLTAQRLNLVDSAAPPESGIAPTMIKMFGVFNVLDDRKQPVIKSWRTTKARDLLAYFVHYNQPVTIDRILDDFWPEMPAENAANNFHTTLYHLRQVLTSIYHGDLICYSNRCYYLSSNAFLTDRQNFEELAAKGLDGKPSPGKIDYLKRSLDIYEGDYLSDMEYAWVLPTREYLRQLYQNIHLHLSQYYMSEEEFQQSVLHLHKLIDISPFTEEYYRSLMSAYAGLADRAAIKELYRQMTQTLKDELGLDPDPETKELYRRLTGAYESRVSGNLPFSHRS